MANTTGMGTMWNLPNYVGELFLIGANQTPFLNMIGGLSGGKQYAAFDFPTAQPWALNSASQPDIDECGSRRPTRFRSFIRQLMCPMPNSPPAGLLLLMLLLAMQCWAISL